MKHLSIIILCLFLFSCADHSSNERKTPSNESIFILIENGGTIAPEEHEDARSTALHLLSQLTKLSRRKATRSAQIYILFSAVSNRIAWSGTPRQLLEQAGHITSLITFKQSFSDLVMAFDQIETTINLTQSDHVRLYWIGSTIHVPFQPNDKEIVIKVPQVVPANLALGNLCDRLKTLKIMRVHPDQDQMLLNYLASIGILASAKSGELDFALLGYAGTKSQINDLL